jgi:hypothetical protein
MAKYDCNVNNPSCIVPVNTGESKLSNLKLTNIFYVASLAVAQGAPIPFAASDVFDDDFNAWDSNNYTYEIQSDGLYQIIFQGKVSDSSTITTNNTYLNIFGEYSEDNGATWGNMLYSIQSDYNYVNSQRLLQIDAGTLIRLRAYSNEDSSLLVHAGLRITKIDIV